LQDARREQDLRKVAGLIRTPAGQGRPRRACGRGLRGAHRVRRVGRGPAQSEERGEAGTSSGGHLQRRGVVTWRGHLADYAARLEAGGSRQRRLCCLAPRRSWPRESRGDRQRMRFLAEMGGLPPGRAGAEGATAFTVHRVAQSRSLPGR
ncbi:unnamed protein product, partial [Prorocentrum cordatum]